MPYALPAADSLRLSVAPMMDWTDSHCRVFHRGLEVTTLSDLGGPSGMDSVKPVLLENLARQFGLRLRTEVELPDLSLAA